MLSWKFSMFLWSVTKTQKKLHLQHPLISVCEPCVLTVVIKMLIPGIIDTRLIDLSSTQVNKQAAHDKHRLSDRISLKDEMP